MTSRLLHPRVLTTAAALAGLYTVCVLVAISTLAASPLVAAGITIDLTLTAALMVYLLAVRPGHLPPVTIAAVVVAGAGLARWQLGHVLGAETIGLLGGGFELALIAIVATRIVPASRGMRAARGAGLSLLGVLEDTLARAGLPRRVAAIGAAEMAIVAYALGGWRRPRRAGGMFTVHVEKGWSLYAGTFVFLVGVEAAALHLPLAAHWPTVAWIATALSAYTAVWILGDALALRHTGVRVDAHGLRIDIGTRWRAEVPWDRIARVERIDGTPEAAPGLVDVSILGANVLVETTEPVEVRGPFGVRKKATRIAMSVDGVEAFIARVHDRSADATARPASAIYV